MIFICTIVVLAVIQKSQLQEAMKIAFSRPGAMSQDL